MPGTGELFRAWCEKVGVDEPGQWLEQAHRGPEFRGVAAFHDHKKRLWNIYLEFLAKENFEAAVKQFNQADLRDDQRGEVIQALWRYSKNKMELLVELLKTTAREERQSWVGICVRSLPDSSLDNFSEIVGRYDFEEDVVDSLTHRIMEDVIFKKRDFKNRLAWLQEL